MLFDLAQLFPGGKLLPDLDSWTAFTIQESTLVAAREAGSNLRKCVLNWISQSAGLRQIDGYLPYIVGEAINNGVEHGDLTHGLTVLASVRLGAILVINHLSNEERKLLAKGTEPVATLELATEAIQLPDGSKRSCHAGLGMIEEMSGGACRYGIVRGRLFVMCIPLSLLA